MKTFIKFFTLVVIGLLFVVQYAHAQPPPPPSPTDVPIDGGLSLLIAAGAALGGKKAWDNRKLKKETNN
jgi:hypothetical protein